MVTIHLVINYPLYVLAWAAWAKWSSCSVSCGSGQASRTRVCEGTGCPGESDQSKVCNNRQCSGCFKKFKNIFGYCTSVCCVIYWINRIEQFALPCLIANWYCQPTPLADIILSPMGDSSPAPVF